MRPIRTLLFGAGGLLALWIGWGAYVSHTTERVPSETLARFDGIEVRRYPRSVLAETTAPDDGTAFRRLFRYISGANARSEDIAMTAPVTTRGESISMTAPVRTDSESDDVRMAFYLPRRTRPTPPRHRLPPTFDSSSNRRERPRCAASRGTRRTSASTGSGADYSSNSRSEGSRCAASRRCSSTTIRGRRRSCERTSSKSLSRTSRRGFVMRRRNPGRSVTERSLPGPGLAARRFRPRCRAKPGRRRSDRGSP